VYSDGLGVPVVVPPSSVYVAPPGTTDLTVAVAKPVPFQSWELVIFPWAYYDEPPTDGQPIKLAGQEADGTTAICLGSPAEGEWYLSAEFDFGNGDHAKYRWHLVIPAS
jgi:hypothetical protein